MIRFLLVMLLLFTPTMLLGGELNHGKYNSNAEDSRTLDLIQTQTDIVLKGGCGGDHDKDEGDEDEEED